MNSGLAAIQSGLLSVLRLARYRFLVLAGLLPYVVGSLAALGPAQPWEPRLFLLGLLGIGAALVAVEAFNEYFDSRAGNDFVFAAEPHPPASRRVFWLGVAFLGLAAALGALLSVVRGPWVMAFAALGACGVVFYVGPPLRLAYRGLGEATIAACYGPLMILGAYYLQAARLTWGVFLASMPHALMMLALVVANEVPDYYQDKLVGKRNLTVRLGRARAARVFGGLLGLAYLSLALCLALSALPAATAALFASAPLAWRMARAAAAHADRPQSFIAVIRNTILLYLLFASAIGLACLLGLPPLVRP